MGANITLPPRRRLIIIPAAAGRMQETPCAWGRISVTVDLAITEKDKATAVPSGAYQQNQVLKIGAAVARGRDVTRHVRK